MQALQIPIPDSPWFGYCITPIAPCLRPADEENGVTPDMCIPILPNKGHPLGRSGLETQPALPFDNCYWSDARCQMDVRVHASPNQFDDDTSIKLPPPERTKIPRFMREDYARMRALREQRAREPRPDQPSQCQDNADAHNILEEAQQLTDVGRVEAVSEGTPALHGCTGDKIGGTMTDAQCGSIEQDESARPTSISDYDQSSGEYSPSPSVMKEVTQQIRTGVIRDKFSRQVELKPLVDLWYDLPGHLKQDSIPNPIDLFFRTGDLDKVRPIATSVRMSDGLNKYPLYKGVPGRATPLR